MDAIVNDLDALCAAIDILQRAENRASDTSAMCILRSARIYVEDRAQAIEDAAFDAFIIEDVCDTTDAIVAR